MASIDRVGDWHSRTTGRYVEKPWTLGDRLSSLTGQDAPPAVKELVAYAQGLEQEMTDDSTEDDIVQMGEKLGDLLDTAASQVDKASAEDGEELDKVLEGMEATAFFLTKPRIWPGASEDEEKPKASSTGYRKVGSERSKTRGVERVKNYTDEEKEALGYNRLPPEQKEEFRRLRKDYLSDATRQSSVRASVFLEEVGALIAAVGADTPLGKELAKWQAVMRRRVGIHAEEEYALTEALDLAQFAKTSNAGAFAAALNSLGDVDGAASVAKYAAAGDTTNLNKLLGTKINALEKAIAALETFVTSFPADGSAEVQSEEQAKARRKEERAASGQEQSNTPRPPDTRSEAEKSAAATKAAETRKAGGGEQWRAPAGSPQGGQFIDMPGSAAAKVGSIATGQQIKSLLDSGDVAGAQKVAEQQLKLMDQALNSLYSMSFSANVVAMTASGGTVTKNKWEGPLGFEGQFTGDNRYIMPMGLDWSNVAFPQPFRWASEDIGAHDGARVIGTIEGIKRLKDGTIWGWGNFDMESPLGKDAQRHVDKGLTSGVSLDLDRISAEVADSAQLAAEIGNLADAVADMNITVIRGARTRSATLVALPAFEGARVKTCEEWSHAKERAAKAENEKLAMEQRAVANRKKQILETWQAKFGAVPTRKEQRVKELAMALRLGEDPKPKQRTILIPVKRA
jgi:hypothetical protein